MAVENAAYQEPVDPVPSIRRQVNARVLRKVGMISAGGPQKALSETNVSTTEERHRPTRHFPSTPARPRFSLRRPTNPMQYVLSLLYRNR